jgi:hypothetical protein
MPERAVQTLVLCLLGESFFGPVAITVASRSPPNLAKPILCCTFDRSPRPAPRLLRSVNPAVSRKIGQRGNE